MTQTPLANREHVAIFGNTNAGKSTLFNLILNQDAAIVSDTRGTTTDPIVKAMELIPFGPIALIDTAGINDKTELGEARMKKTRQMLDRTNLALYLADISDFDRGDYDEFLELIKPYSINHILIFTKTDIADENALSSLKAEFTEAEFVSSKDAESISRLKKRISDTLSEKVKDDTILGDLLPSGSMVVAVVPVDSEAPKGRLILPQVQLIRDCLDHGIKVTVTRDTELADTLDSLKKVDLVVTDSQAFNFVNKIVPPEIMLTSFSILFGRHKGDIKEYIDGAKAVANLKPGSKIAITEGCTHNHTHEDIGRVKIPNWLKKHVGGDLSFDFFAGHDFPENTADYDLVIQCGGCMQNAREIQSRIMKCTDKHIPITNYGILIALMNGILDRSTEILIKK